MERLKGLDGIRGILSVIVALSHAYGHYTGWDSGIYPVRNASYAVDIFFILSGIVLYHVYHERLKKDETNFYEFVLIRILRLYPMHIFCMMLIPISLYISAGVFYPNWIQNVTPHNIFGDILLMNSINVGFSLATNQPSWSISVELYAGTLTAFICCKSRIMPYLLAIFSVIIAFCFSIPPVGQGKAHVLLLNSGIVRCLFSMSLGIISYSVMKYFLPSIIKNILMVRLIALIGFGVILITSFSVTLTPLTYFLITFISAASISINAVIGVRCLNFLDSRYFLMLGKRSFSIYLLHTPVLYLFLRCKSENQISNSILAFLLIMLTIFLSKYTTKYIEHPFISFYHQKVHQRR